MGMTRTAIAYKQKVLSRNRSTLYASLSWLGEIGAIDQADLGTFEKPKESRNQIAHGMPQLVLAGPGFEYPALFPDLVALLRKVETWWIVNVQIRRMRTSTARRSMKPGSPPVQS